MWVRVMKKMISSCILLAALFCVPFAQAERVIGTEFNAWLSEQGEGKDKDVALVEVEAGPIESVILFYTHAATDPDPYFELRYGTDLTFRDGESSTELGKDYQSVTWRFKPALKGKEKLWIKPYRGRAFIRQVNVVYR